MRATWRRWALLASLAVLVLSPLGAALPCTDTDALTCDALLLFYNSTGGPLWNNNSGWAAAAPTAACSFYGVTCDAGNRVTTLRLASNNLSGSLPASVFTALSSLITLDLRNNGLTGGLPGTLGSLPLLATLALDNNPMGGTLPPSLGSQLTSVSLSRMYLTGPVPTTYASLPNLTLSGNLLDGAAFPQALCQAACTWSSAFTCPALHGCSLAAGCQAQCTFASCNAVSGISATALAGARSACTAVASTCSTCLPSMLASAVGPGGAVSSTQAAACVQRLVPLAAAAGANSDALRALPTCLAGAISPPARPCPVVLTSSAAATMAVDCTSAANACQSCMPSTLTAVVAAGVTPATGASIILTKAQYYGIQECTKGYFGTLVAAGVPPAGLMALWSCPIPPAQQSALSVTLTLAGVAPGNVSAAAFCIAVESAIGAAANQVAFVSASPASARRRLLQTSALVALTIDADTAMQQALFGAALYASARNGSLLSALRAAGIASTGISVISAPAPPASGGSPGGPPGVGVVAGASAGGAAGGATLIACLALVVIPRLRRRLRSAALPLIHSDSSSVDSDAYASTFASKGVTIKGDTDSRASNDTADTKKSGDSQSDDTSAWARGLPAAIVSASEVHLKEPLGGGGFGTVYRAHWRGVPVAVKVFGAPELAASGSAAAAAASFSWPDITTDQASADSMDSFINEVQLLSRLRHPNVLTVYAVVPTPPHMLVMELGACGSLAAYLRRVTLQDLPWQRRCEILTGVACGIEFLHSQEPAVCHMDIKSSNVVLSETLTPKVADFGISALRLKAADGMLNAPVGVRGTPDYMAPEVARGQAISSWEAVDVYGFGWVTHDVAHINTRPTTGAMVTEPEAQQPATGAAEPTPSAGNPSGAIQILYRRESAGFKCHVEPWVPQPLAAMVRACLAVDPHDRPTMRVVRFQLIEMQTHAAMWGAHPPVGDRRRSAEGRGPRLHIGRRMSLPS